MRLYFTIYKGDGAQTRPLAILGVRVALPSCVRFEWAIFPSILRALDTSRFQKSNDGMKWDSSKNRWVDYWVWPIKLCSVKWTDFEHQKGLRGGVPTYIPISAHGKKRDLVFSTDGRVLFQVFGMYSLFEFIECCSNISG